MYVSCGPIVTCLHPAYTPASYSIPIALKPLLCPISVLSLRMPCYCNLYYCLLTNAFPGGDPETITSANIEYHRQNPNHHHAFHVTLYAQHAVLILLFSLREIPHLGHNGQHTRFCGFPITPYESFARDCSHTSAPFTPHFHNSSRDGDYCGPLTNPCRPLIS